MPAIKEELKIPYVSSVLTEYLEETFQIDSLLNSRKLVDNADERLGYIKGVRDVIGHLKALQKEREEN